MSSLKCSNIMFCMSLKLPINNFQINWTKNLRNPSDVALSRDISRNTRISSDDLAECERERNVKGTESNYMDLRAVVAFFPENLAGHFSFFGSQKTFLSLRKQERSFSDVAKVRSDNALKKPSCIYFFFIQSVSATL